jgi:hypothetical protein
MKYGRRMRGGEGDVYGDEVTGDVTGEYIESPETADDMMGSEQTGGKHRHSKRCKHMKKRSMKKRKGTKRKGTKRSTKKRSMKKKSMRKGGGVLETAVVPFGLFGLQRYFQKHSMKKMTKKVGNKVRGSFSKVRKML